MRHTLPSEVPLFALLIELAELLNQSGDKLRVIGGLAMTFWHLEAASQPRMTEDIDCAFLGSDWPSEEAARPKIQNTLRVLEALGLECAAGPETRASRTARFTWRKPEQLARVELICGQLTFGKASRRKPAWRIFQTSGGQPIYASRLDWLDLVEDWVDVRVTVSTLQASLAIPSIFGLMLLKLKAVVDKFQRCDDERGTKRFEHEASRLERHSLDLLTLVAWAQEESKEQLRFQAVKRSSEAVQEAIASFQHRVLLPPPSPELAPLFARLRSLALQL